MSNFNTNFNGGRSGTGLYRVWVPVQKNGRTQLASIRIDPTMTAFERHDQACAADRAASAKQNKEKITEQIEEVGRRPLRLRAA